MAERAGVSCQDEGTIVINQSGTNFTGSANQVGICTDNAGNATGSKSSSTRRAASRSSCIQRGEMAFAATLCAK